MVRDAEQYAEEDARRREVVETRNQADGLVYTTEKFISENSDKLPEDVKTEVQADVDALKKVLEDQDADKDALQAAIAKVGESSQKMGAAMYANAASEESSAGSDGSAGTQGDGNVEDDVVDAEIVDEPGEDESK
jgi:molecular chaperone DnaK